MKREKTGWDNFKKDLPPSVRTWRIENQITSGMSDVYGMNGKGNSFWLENKALESWPKRESTLPLLLAFEKGQLAFLREIRSKGGHGYVLLCVDKLYYLLDPLRFDLKRSTSSQIVHDSICGPVKFDIIRFLENL